MSLMPDPEVTKPVMAAEKGPLRYANASVCSGLAGRCFVGTPTESIWLAVLATGSKGVKGGSGLSLAGSQRHCTNTDFLMESATFQNTKKYLLQIWSVCRGITFPKVYH